MTNNPKRLLNVMHALLYTEKTPTQSHFNPFIKFAIFHHYNSSLKTINIQKQKT